MSKLGDVLRPAGVPERISRPQDERFVTLRVKGGGAVERPRRDGKMPVPFTGYRVTAGQFIYSRIDARNGAYAIVPPQLDGAVVSKDFPVFTVEANRIDPSYLIHYMRAGSLQRQVQSASFGATNRQRVSEDVFLAFDLPLPDLDEQRRIAAILDRADAIRAKRRHVLDHLDVATQAIFAEMFPVGSHEALRAGSLMPRMRNGLSPATAGSFPATVLTLSSITRGAFDGSAVKPGVFTVDPPPDKRVSAEDFLMCRGNGNKHLVGVGAFSPENRPELVFPDTVIAGTVDTGLMTMRFLEAAWKRPEVRAQIEEAARTTNGTYKVNQQTLSEILVPVPPLDRQMVFGEKTTFIDRLRDRNVRALAADDELFASLQSRAFRGEL